MSRFVRAVAGISVVFGATSNAVAQERGFVVQVLGGGYSHVQNLSSTGVATHWNTGFSSSVSAGYQVNRYFGVHADAGFARNKALGPSTFANRDFNRFFYGGHLEVRYPTGRGVTPFAFAGGGAMTIDQRGTTGLETFTKPAGMFGAGLELPIRNSKVSFMLEGKGFLFNWDRAGFDRTQFDVSYAAGFAYRFGK